MSLINPKYLFVIFVTDLLIVGSINVAAESSEEIQPIILHACEPATDIYFETNRADLKAENLRDLCSLTALINTPGFRTTSVIVKGHTDNLEDDKLALSLKRANNVAQYFLDQGIDTKIIKVEGLGNSFPITSNQTSRARAANRRVDFYISGEWVDERTQDARREDFCERISRCYN